MPGPERRPIRARGRAACSGSRETREYTVRFITPMFGGGLDGQGDQLTFPIRPAAIRGQLQFWWRATVGAQYMTAAALRAAQSEVWGSVERASRVEVLVLDVRTEAPMRCAFYEAHPRHPGKYRAVPTWNPPFAGTSLPHALSPLFQGKLTRGRTSVDIEPAACIREGSFQLLIRCAKEFWPQIERAIWAWANFGGLGSRTRRGCGAIFCAEFAPPDSGSFADRCAPLLKNGPVTREWPILAAAILAGTEEHTAIQAWDRIAGLMQLFRQGAETGRQREQGSSRQAVMCWTEPAADRGSAGLPVDGQEPGSSAGNGHPKTVFPPPTGFNWGDGEHAEPGAAGPDPGSGRADRRQERLAGSLILKPLALANGRAVPLIALLRSLPVAGTDARGSAGPKAMPGSAVIYGPPAATYHDAPAGGSTDGPLVEAFLEFARSAGFQEVCA